MKSNERQSAVEVKKLSRLSWTPSAVLYKNKPLRNGFTTKRQTPQTTTNSTRQYLVVLPVGSQQEDKHSTIG